MTFRERARPLKKLINITANQHSILKKKGISNREFWSTTDVRFRPLVAKFKEQIKKHYFFDQRGMCCYCSSELQYNAKTYDAEHILDKSTHPNFMFEPNNFGASCVVCNSHKSKKNVLKRSTTTLRALPRRSSDYLLIHPHLDEWDDYLYFDSIKRVVARAGKQKGVQTIKICGINSINFMRLAMRFSQDKRQEAYRVMTHANTLRTNKRVQENLDLLERLAANSIQARAAAKAVRSMLKKT